MRSCRRWQCGLFAAAMLLAPVPAWATISFTINYDYDSFSFFNPSTTQGMQARAALQSAASFYGGILTDSLVEIKSPKYTSATANVTWNWSKKFDHPSATSEISLADEIVPANTYVIYAGAKSYPSGTLAIGGPGGSQYGYSGFWAPSEEATVNGIQANFVSAITKRGEAIGTATWGGTVSFNRDTVWHYNHATAPIASTNDLYSVALHELAHVLGFGTSSIWNGWIDGSNFKGPAAMTSYGGPVPLYDSGHWQDGITSPVFGGGPIQTPVMAHAITVGTRRQLTNLDAAGLTDTGWQISAAPTVPGDYNRNGVVDAADYVVWRNTFGTGGTMGAGADGSGNGMIGNEDYTYWRGRFARTSGSGAGASVGDFSGAVPEPASLTLAVFACIMFLSTRRKPRG